MTGFARKMGQTPHGWCQVSLCKRQVGGQTHFSGKSWRNVVYRPTEG